MINNFGAAYTLRNIDDEPYIEMQLMQICLTATEKAQANQGKKNMFYAKERI